MPLNNSFFGVYNIASINTGAGSPQPYIIKTLKASQNMDANPAFFMQGTILTKILDIKHVKETITLNAPILSMSNNGNQSLLQDGLALFKALVGSKYGYTNNITLGAGFSSLPMLTHASINVSVEQSNIDMTLLSDGDPNNTINVYNIQPGNNALLNAIGIGTYAARISKNWDIFVNLGGITLFVENMTINIDVETKDVNFLGSATNWNYNTVPSDGLNGGTWTNPLDTSYSGYQFPFIAAGGVKIEATGKAVISIYNNNGVTNYVNFGLASEVVNTRLALLANSNVTLQDTGVLSMTTGTFSAWLSVPPSGIGATVSLLPPAFSINNAVITMKEANFTPELMEIDFRVLAFVGS